MIRLRPLLLTLLFLALLPLAPGSAAATPLRFDRDLTLDWPLRGDRAVRVTFAPAHEPLARFRFLTVEITLLPSGRLLARTVLALPGRPLRDEPPVVEPLILPLPGAMPLFVGALAGLVLVGRRRRPAAALAAPGTGP